MIKIENRSRWIGHWILLLSYTLLSSGVLAHNGVSTLVYPVKNIKIDGDLSDWVSLKRYPLLLTPSDMKPNNGKYPANWVLSFKW